MSTIIESELPQTVSEHRVNSSAHENLHRQIDDGSSSSLSDPDDRTGNEEGDDLQDVEEDGSEGFDTEAETERLEKTPRKQRNVLLTPSNAPFPEGELITAREEQRGESPMEEDPQQTSDSTLGETGDEDEALRSSSASRKRKHAEYSLATQETRYTVRNTTGKESKPSMTPSPDASLGSPTPLGGGDDETQQQEINLMQSRVKHTSRKGKRKGKKTKEEAASSKGVRIPQPETLEEAADHGGIASSNGEDVEMEDIVERDGADADNTAKTEEDLAKKRTAMDALSAIENCFATLRDKLFDERLAQCNDELAMLEQPTFIHPELLLMKEVIDRRRNQKMKYERTLLKYKLESLQRESIANKAQMHSQYMQTVGELRDSYLSQINAEIYRTQRERRSCEADVPDYMYAFTTRRSKQITEQTAYNEEVSLLSGIAKYVGFPAAPDIIRIRPDEWEQDERTYRHNVALEDEAKKARRASQHHPPLLRASMSAASTFGRQPPAAEVQFLQQNAWANPQHPVHQKDRQNSTHSQGMISSATPANQRRLVEQQGSASTIPEQSSAPNSSVVPIPVTGEAGGDAHTESNPVVSHHVKDATPSKVLGILVDEHPGASARSGEKPASATSIRIEPSPSPLSAKALGRENDTPGALPKPLPFAQKGGTSRASPPIRNPVVKAEDPSSIYRHTPIARHFQGSPPINATSKG